MKNLFFTALFSSISLTSVYASGSNDCSSYLNSEPISVSKAAEFLSLKVPENKNYVDKFLPVEADFVAFPNDPRISPLRNKFEGNVKLGIVKEGHHTYITVDFSSLGIFSYERIVLFENDGLSNLNSIPSEAYLQTTYKNNINLRVVFSQDGLGMTIFMDYVDLSDVRKELRVDFKKGNDGVIKYGSLYLNRGSDAYYIAGLVFK